MNPPQAHARALEIIEAGPLCTVQDLGRIRVAWLGVSPGGAVDAFSARAANRIVGNADDAALVETTLRGATIRTACRAHIAVTGADCELHVAGRRKPLWRCHEVERGHVIVVGPARRGMRSYLAVDGGIAVRRALDGAATDVGAGFGGHQGRVLRSGDRLPVGPRGKGAAGAAAIARTIEGATYLWSGPPVCLRVIVGPHADVVGDAALEELLGRTFRATTRASRQAVRLEGLRLELTRSTDIISAGAVAGCVQIPSDGLPVILLAEHQTTAGYAIAACVIAADVPKAAQLRAGDEVRFARATLAEAGQALAQMVEALVPVEGEVTTPDADGLEARLAPGFFEGA